MAGARASVGHLSKLWGSVDEVVSVGCTGVEAGGRVDDRPVGVGKEASQHVADAFHIEIGRLPIDSVRVGYLRVALV